jgi:5-methylcytosine-specific restriction protein A
MTRRVTGFSPAVRQLVKGRSGGTCEAQANLDAIEQVANLDDRWRQRLGKYCGCRGGEAVHVHHRRNRGAGGSKRLDTNLPSNGLHVCLNCHELFGLNPWVGYAGGWLLRQPQDPLSEPVFYRGSWHLLDDFGGRVPTEQPVEETAKEVRS